MNPTPLQYDQIYHIYNRGNNRENLFREKRNYAHFLKLYQKHIVPVAMTYAYCLLPNHFHLLVKIRQPADEITRTPSQAFSNLFNAYTKAINQAYERTGSLFEKSFHRLVVSDEKYFWNVIRYIHQNPERHGLIDDFRQWPYSSYEAILSEHSTQVSRTAVLDWFGGAQSFTEAHGDMAEMSLPY